MSVEYTGFFSASADVEFAFGNFSNGSQFRKRYCSLRDQQQRSAMQKTLRWMLFCTLKYAQTME